MEAAGGGAAPDCIGLHDFSGQLGEQRVHFHAMRLQDSLFLWVGAAPALSSLAVAMCNPRRARVHLPAGGPLRHRLRLPGPAPGQEDQKTGICQLQSAKHRQQFHLTHRKQDQGRNDGFS
eukprot:XP_015131501.1 proteasome assembly chaperone 4 isoform X2 [Gallus gallus]